MTVPTKKQETISFSKALEGIKKGHRLSRRGWNGKNMFVFLVEGSTFEVDRPPLNKIYRNGKKINYRGHIDMKAVDESIGPWLASQTDLLSEDWFIVHEKK